MRDRKQGWKTGRVLRVQEVQEVEETNASFSSSMQGMSLDADGGDRAVLRMVRDEVEGTRNEKRAREPSNKSSFAKGMGLPVPETFR